LAAALADAVLRPEWSGRPIFDRESPAIGIGAGYLTVMYRRRCNTILPRSSIVR
jgi:hypothetical protein